MSDFDSCYTIRHGKLILKILPNNYLHNNTAKYLTGGMYTFNKQLEKGKVIRDFKLKSLVWYCVIMLILFFVLQD